MAGRGNPSFLKNQKARKRVERATAKRAARQARKAERAAGRMEGDPTVDLPASTEPEVSDGRDPSAEGTTDPGA